MDIAALEAANKRAQRTQLQNKRKAAIQLAPQSASIELQTENNESDINLERVPITAASMGNVQVTSVVLFSSGAKQMIALFHCSY